RRWGSGFTQKLFIRRYVPPAERSEVRVHLEDKVIVDAWQRHTPEKRAQAPDVAAIIAKLMPDGNPYHVDFLFVQGRWYLSDINPVLGRKAMQLRA
ncbi:MAG: hypothetical protein ACRC6I_15710, partial [Paracoccaceae bacterium]